ncbi:Reticulocyte-binding protein-like protein a [Lachnellula willkommii]|uniref:Reticulocyte-binding protein-like protein a n=1 Tax=Lachnellula willkommii TaxID=215461 RepID=A0A559MDU0_9HELO|nr:Reticulocyte-binding protein-like protein a [Lachnellula willkommii]
MSLSRIPLTQVFRSKSNSTSSTSSDSGTTSPQTRDTTPIFSSPVRANTLPGFGMAQPNGGARGTRTPQMLEYERQAEERQKEYDRMQEERERMQEAEDKIQQEQERIAQEEYEMRQYYEAEALKHAEEMRVHQEEIRRHQQRVREHQRRLQDHEASAEAFARVIAMPAKQGRDKISFIAAPRKNSATTNGNGQAPAQFLE